MRSDLAPGSKGGENAIVAVLGLVCDFDDPQATQWETRTPITPTAILETSPGRFQAFYLFSTSLDPMRAKDQAARLQAYDQCDFGRKDLSHVWRIGGTLNWPNKKKLDAGRSPDPYLVTEVSGGCNTVTDPAALDAALPVLAPPVTRPSPRPTRPIEADDQALVDKMLNAANSAKIRALWNGDWSAYPTQSEGDLALCCHLAFWSGRDEIRMDRLFRRSGLMRDKWDSLRGDTTYGVETIALACAGCTETYSETRPARPITKADATSPGPDTSGEIARMDREPGLVKELSDEILRTDHFARDAGGQLYVFERGAYRPHGDDRIAQRVKAVLLAHGDVKKWSSHRAREVVEFIRVDAPRLWERPLLTVMNLTNGLLDVTTGALSPHSPGHLSPVQLPVAFDPAATCPLWESFTARVLPADCHALPFEIIASAMRGDVSDQQAALAVGPGDNGKSTCLEGIISFLGRDNVSALALQRIEVDKFAVVRLLDKLANVCADLPSEALAGTSTFKALTGGDRMTAERKFQGSFEFRPFARLIFSTNHYPTSKDASHAFFRRWLVIPFDAVLDPREKIPNFAAQLSSPGELSGVLNRALAALPGMAQRGGFTLSESTQAAMMEFREATDPLAAWLDRFTTLSPDGMVSRKDLAISYNAAAETAGRPLMTSKAFCAAVRRLRPTVKDAQRTLHGDVKDVFLGLGLRAPGAPATPPDGLFAEEVVHDDH
jgi:putative DNA primase/helicase